MSFSDSRARRRGVDELLDSRVREGAAKGAGAGGDGFERLPKPTCLRIVPLKLLLCAALSVRVTSDGVAVLVGGGLVLQLAGSGLVPQQHRGAIAAAGHADCGRRKDAGYWTSA